MWLILGKWCVSLCRTITRERWMKAKMTTNPRVCIPWVSAQVPNVSKPTSSGWRPQTKLSKHGYFPYNDLNVMGRLSCTKPRLHGRVLSFGLGIGQSRAVSPLFCCVACTFLSRALVFVFVGPVARRHTNTNIERCRANSTVGKEGYMSRGWGHWFESEVKLTLKSNPKSGGFGWKIRVRLLY